MREVDFLPEWYPKVRQRKRRLALQTWVTFLLVGGLGLWMLLVQRNVHAKETELRTIRTDLVQSETELQRLEDLLKLQTELGRQEEIFFKIGRPVETTRVMTTLDEIMPKEMALLDLTLDTEDPPPRAATPVGARPQAASPPPSKLRFHLHGVAPTDVALAEFIAKLTNRSIFKNVELLYSHERVDRSHVMREFEVAFDMELVGLGGGH